MVSAAFARFIRYAAGAALLVPLAVFGTEGGARLQTAHVNAHDLASLQNGAKVFVNYCLNCHSAGYMRYNRLQDLGLTEQQIKDNLIFTGVKVGELMQVAIDKNDAKQWFGIAPPDLTVTARSRSSGAGSGADWIYTYLRSFYVDPSRPSGWNNLVYPNVGMPHVLWQLNGKQELVEEEFESEHAAKATLIAAKSVAEMEEVTVTREGKSVKRYVVKSLRPGTGTQSQLDYDKTVVDLVNYMSYMAEPARLERRQVGFYALMVLGLLFILVFALKKSYWKDVH